jgi:hypothetical protein
VHLVDDGFVVANLFYHPVITGSTRFFIFFGGGLRMINRLKTNLLRRLPVFIKPGKKTHLPYLT